MNARLHATTHQMMALAAMALLLPATVAAQTFRIIDLGTLAGPGSEANAIADDNTVAGAADLAHEQRAPFRKECEECPILNLGFLANGTSGFANAISNSGYYVAGNSGTTSVRGGLTPIRGTEVTQAFVWHKGTMHELGALYNPTHANRRHGHSEAHGVNDQGQVVGFSVVFRANAYHAFLWQSGIMRDISADPVSADITRAFAINNKSQIVGDVANATDQPLSWPLRSAFLWEDGSTRDLGTLDGHTASSARAINEHSQIVGWSGVTESDYADLLWSHAVLWQDGVIRDLGTLPGDNSSQALAINDKGAVTGWSGSSDQEASRAFLWQGEELQDLNTLIAPDTGWHLREARDINNAGRIVGVGLKDGQLRAYQLIPLPDSESD